MNRRQRRNTGQPPLHVLFVGLSWPPETFLARLIRGLAGRGLQITVAASREPGADWRAVPNVQFLSAPEWGGPLPARLWRVGTGLGQNALRSPRRTRRLLTEAVAAKGTITDAGPHPAELLHRWLPFSRRAWDAVYLPWNSAAVAYMPLMETAPSVISCRGAQINVAPHNPQRIAFRRELRMTFERATAVHCVSEAIREEAARYGLDPAKAVVIRPAVDPDAFAPGSSRLNGQQDGAFRIVTTGGIVWRKGHEYALRALRLLVDRGVPAELDLIGDGQETQRLLFTIDDLGLSNRVHLHGRLAPGEVLRRLQAADVFLLPSLSEGISNAVLEAMACGLPIVTTDVGGMAEAVTDGVEGFLVPPRNALETAAALERLWRQPALRANMGAAGLARIVRDFCLDDQIDAFVDLFRSVA